MTKKVNSFDIFDTLIGRFCGHPENVFKIVAEKASRPTFWFERIRAERETSDKTWEGIWRKYKEITKLSDEKVEFLADLELETEYEQSFPIKETMAKVKDGDLLISDMYLREEQIRLLLSKHKFNKNVKIFVYYDGKSVGWIWDKLKKEGYEVQLHLGDNFTSDVTNPKNYGIKTEHYSESAFTFSEEHLIKTNKSQLAYLSRLVRLGFDPTKVTNVDVKVAKTLWWEQSLMNVPVLLAACGTIKSFKFDRVLFSTRDTCLLKKVYDAICDPSQSVRFISSRVLFTNETPDYKKYLERLITDDTLIVDIHGTGKTIMQCISAHKFKPTVLMLSYSQINPNFENYPKKFSWLTGIDDELERLNIDIVGTYFDFYNNTPVSWIYEFDQNKTMVFHNCIDYLVEFLKGNCPKVFRLENFFDENLKFWIKAYYKPEFTKKNFDWTTTHFPPHVNIRELRTFFRQKVDEIGKDLTNLQMNDLYQLFQTSHQESETTLKNSTTNLSLTLFGANKHDSGILSRHTSNVVSYSSEWVEGFIKRLNFKRGGCFIDIGARDGITNSSTNSLEKLLNWKGVCTEVDPYKFKSLIKNRKCNCSNEFIFSNDTNSIFELALKSSTDKVIVSPTSITSLFGQFNLPSTIDLLVVNPNNGTELDIVKSVISKQFKILTILITSNPKATILDEIDLILTATGYKQEITKNGEFIEYRL